MDANQRLPLSGREHHNGGASPAEHSSEAGGDAGLADLVTPPGPDTFLTKVYGRGYQVFRTSDPARFRTLGGWDELNRPLADQSLDSSQLRLVRRGRLVPEDTCTVTEITRFRQTWQRVLPAALARQ
ncbi:hypothetical protein [Streptomyces uncialis]|uniref:hypothetical protein n=1 Tax=Streptomyces uncialis TaxID=1048205 RepID=UPI002253F63A|nr:hypothetical protein [Streptomyces uncialis]MCX4657718.1 hypothetical protein [Streptomyces uncialis]